MASEKRQIDILHKLWEWEVGEIVTQQDLNKMFLAKDIWGRTAWHMKARKDKINILYKLSEWAKEVLTREELINFSETKMMVKEPPGIWQQRVMNQIYYTYIGSGIICTNPKGV